MNPGEGRRILDDPETGPDDVLALVRDRKLPAELLARIGGDRRWTARHTIRRALVLNPSTPTALARNLIPFLYWRELVEVANAPQVDPVIRRAAERRLTICLEELAIGEKVALARVAPRALVAPLVAAREERVIESVLGNPRLIEMDAVVIARRATPRIATVTARHSRWGSRRDVRLALVRNPATPVAVALGIVATLDRHDTVRLARDESAPNIVRMAARRSSGGRSLERGPALG